MSLNIQVRKYILVASLSFLTGLVFCMTGILFAMVSRLSRSSASELILTVCFLLGAGILLMLAGINVAGMRQRLSRSYSFLAGLLLSATGLLVFAFSFPDNWLYPRVSYVIVFYSLGIFLLLINIFVNYFLHAFPGSCEQGTVTREEDTDIDDGANRYNDRSTLATFAGIMMTNITSGFYEPSLLIDTNNIDAAYSLYDNSPEKGDNGEQIMEQIEENAANVPFQNEISKTGAYHEDDGFIELKNPENTEVSLNEEVHVSDDIDVPDDISDEVPVSDTALVPSLELQEGFTVNVPSVPFSEFRSMKRTGIKATDTMRKAARKILMFHFGVMVEHERGTKVGGDIGELHDMRVAAMRMRSIIEVLEDYLDMKKMYPHYRNIKRTRKVLGSVRDLDVLLGEINHFLEDNPPESRAGMDPLNDSVLIERAKQRGNMLVYLDDVGYNKFKNDFADYLLKKKFWKISSVKKNDEPVPCRVADMLPVLVYTQFATVRSYAQIIEHGVMDPYLEKYHQLRIDVKILRYTLEFFKEVLGSESNDLISDLKAVQDNMGDMHDTVVALELLEKFKKYGRWGEVGKKQVAASSRLHDYPGVDAYIEYRKRELQNLVDGFPEAWARVIEPDFCVRLSQAIAGIYNS
jgi:CHAD domain-containing protein